MLRNDCKPDLKWTDTRILRKTVEEYHRNNPHVSLEAAFEYVMLNSATFRTLPTACIEKARKYLALPIVGIKPKEITSEYNPSLFLVTQDKITPIGWAHIISDDSADTLEAPKPGTTVVHAERVVVDDKKMIKILKFENVHSANEVPVSYLKKSPYYILERDISTKYILLTISDYLIDSMVIKVDDLISIKDFGQMIKTMKEAGVRLAEINKTAKLEKEHSGKFTVSI